MSNFIFGNYILYYFLYFAFGGEYLLDGLGIYYEGRLYKSPRTTKLNNHKEKSFHINHSKIYTSIFV